MNPYNFDDEREYLIGQDVYESHMFDYIYDQDFMDTLAWIQALPTVKDND